MSATVDPRLRTRRFAMLVARLLRYGIITQDEATALLTRYQGGTTAPEALLSLPPEQVVVRPSADTIAAALLLVQRLGRSKRIPLRTFDTRTGPLARLSEKASTVFEQTARTLATRVANGEMTVAEWQAAFADEVACHLLQQAMIGSGSPTLSTETLTRVGNEILVQRAYVSRFADQMSLKQLQEQPMTEAYIANRATLYGGAGHAEYFKSGEEAITALTPDGGYVVYYRAVDDKRTCSPCLAAEAGSPYLMSEGPYPGDVCLGLSRCRCWRDVVYSPQDWERLNGKVRTA
jgi:hypothetical protein